MLKHLLFVALLSLSLATGTSLTGEAGKFILFQEFSDSGCSTEQTRYYAWEIGTCSQFTIGNTASSKIEVASSKLALRVYSQTGCQGNSNSVTGSSDLTDIKTDSCHQIGSSRYIKPISAVLDRPVFGDFYQTEFRYGQGSSCNNLDQVTIEKRGSSNVVVAAGVQVVNCVQTTTSGKYKSTHPGSDFILLKFWNDQDCTQAHSDGDVLRNSKCHSYNGFAYKLYYMSGKLLTAGFMVAISLILAILA